MAKRKSLISRLWDKLSKPKRRKRPAASPPPPPPPPPYLPPPPPPRIPAAPYISGSDSNERIAARLIRIFSQNQYARYRRRGVRENTVRRNVDRMPQHVKDIAQRADSFELMHYARYPEHTDDDGNNYFWYH